MELRPFHLVESRIKVRRRSTYRARIVFIDRESKCKHRLCRLHFFCRLTWCGFEPLDCDGEIIRRHGRAGKAAAKILAATTRGAQRRTRGWNLNCCSMRQKGRHRSGEARHYPDQRRLQGVGRLGALTDIVPVVADEIPPAEEKALRRRRECSWFSAPSTAAAGAPNNLRVGGGVLALRFASFGSAPAAMPLLIYFLWAPHLRRRFR